MQDTLATISTEAASRMADYFGAALGLGMIVIGSAVGIGLIATKALDAIARQPDMKNEIRTLMVLGAALIEGVAFFAAVICLLIVLLK